jgi:hypothetical protein
MTSSAESGCVKRVKRRTNANKHGLEILMSPPIFPRRVKSKKFLAQVEVQYMMSAERRPLK